MFSTEAVSIFSALISFASVFIVLFRVHGDTEQRRLESLIQIQDINRQLVTLGFANPELFDILQDGKDTDPVWERRYLQLWLNQLALIHAYKQRGILQQELQVSLEHEIQDFMKMENMRRHWRLHREFYPASFRSYVDAVCDPGKQGGRG